MNKKAGVTWVVACMIVWVLVGLALEKNFSTYVSTDILIAISVISFAIVVAVSLVKLIYLKKRFVGKPDFNRVVLSNFNLVAGPTVGTFAASVASIVNWGACLDANWTIRLAAGGSVGLAFGLVNFFTFWVRGSRVLENEISKADQKEG